MITENDLLAAIAECQGQRNPNANTCIKLAAYYTILDHITGKTENVAPVEVPSYAYAAAPTYKSDSDFYKVASDLDYDTIMRVIDELMTTLSAVQPRLYAAVMRKLEQ